ncbi:hypothetical protein QTO34_014668 [Cnephaeus nilssonii]|uniref:Large ribosomal subunit protein uL15/eL18 domain-containing protein n=1 Tax=Cnephaeus nilssonii TaxID=3371016 RepID=A0AA40I703_CNENI|nr:hypothetical protein QTO34_014668 [Eptesicus nilssonii]
MAAPAPAAVASGAVAGSGYKRRLLALIAPQEQGEVEKFSGVIRASSFHWHPLMAPINQGRCWAPAAVHTRVSRLGGQYYSPGPGCSMPTAQRLSAAQRPIRGPAWNACLITVVTKQAFPRPLMLLVLSGRPPPGLWDSSGAERTGRRHLVAMGAAIFRYTVKGVEHHDPDHIRVPEHREQFSSIRHQGGRRDRGNNKSFVPDEEDTPGKQTDEPPHESEPFSEVLYQPTPLISDQGVEERELEPTKGCSPRCAAGGPQIAERLARTHLLSEDFCRCEEKLQAQLSVSRSSGRLQPGAKGLRFCRHEQPQALHSGFSLGKWACGGDWDQRLQQSQWLSAERPEPQPPRAGLRCRQASDSGCPAVQGRPKLRPGGTGGTIMGVDIHHNKDRKAPKSQDIYLGLLAKLYRFLARRTNSTFNHDIEKVKLHSREGKPTVVVGTTSITSDVCMQEVSKLTVCALRVSSHQSQLLKSRSKMLIFNQLALDSPKGCATILLSGPCNSSQPLQILPVVQRLEVQVLFLTPQTPMSGLSGGRQDVVLEVPCFRRLTPTEVLTSLQGYLYDLRIGPLFGPWNFLTATDGLGTSASPCDLNKDPLLPYQSFRPWAATVTATGFVPLNRAFRKPPAAAEAFERPCAGADSRPGPPLWPLIAGEPAACLSAGAPGLPKASGVAMAQTLSSRRHWRRELSVLLAQSATPATLSPAPCASCWPNRGRSGVMIPYLELNSRKNIERLRHLEGESGCDWKPSLTINREELGYLSGPYNHNTQGPAANPRTPGLKQCEYADTDKPCAFSRKERPLNYTSIRPHKTCPGHGFSVEMTFQRNPKESEGNIHKNINLGPWKEHVKGLETLARVCHLHLHCGWSAAPVDPFVPALPLIAGVLPCPATLCLKRLGCGATSIFVLLICIFPPDWLVGIVEDVLKPPQDEWAKLMTPWKPSWPWKEPDPALVELQAQGSPAQTLSSGLPGLAKTT